MDEISSRFTELELLLSMYQVGVELDFLDPRLNVSSNTIDTLSQLHKEDIAFKLKISGAAVLHVQMPAGYLSAQQTGNIAQPIMTFRLAPSSGVSGREERLLATRFSEWLDEIVTKSVEGNAEPVICAAIEWLRTELIELSQLQQQHSQNLSDAAPCDQSEKTVCLWIVSHHIRSPTKRRLILHWAAELKLCGCSMPGRPGIVVVEGASEEAEEFWRRLRGLQWKHIQLRDRETLGEGAYTASRFTDGFHELFLTHQSRFSWLNEHNVPSEQFQLVFGIPGRVKGPHT